MNGTVFRYPIGLHGPRTRMSHTAQRDLRIKLWVHPGQAASKEATLGKAGNQERLFQEA